MQYLGHIMFIHLENRKNTEKITGYKMRAACPAAHSVKITLVWVQMYGNALELLTEISERKVVIIFTQF